MTLAVHLKLQCVQMHYRQLSPRATEWWFFGDMGEWRLENREWKTLPDRWSLSERRHYPITLLPHYPIKKALRP
jgi:hypothetical protein